MYFPYMSQLCQVEKSRFLHKMKGFDFGRAKSKLSLDLGSEGSLKRTGSIPKAGERERAISHPNALCTWPETPWNHPFGFEWKAFCTWSETPEKHSARDQKFQEITHTHTQLWEKALYTWPETPWKKMELCVHGSVICLLLVWSYHLSSPLPVSKAWKAGDAAVNEGMVSNYVKTFQTFQ